MKHSSNRTMERENAKEHPKDQNHVRETIAVLAYKFSEERGDESGSPVDDWLRAEEVVRKQHAHQS